MRLTDHIEQFIKEMMSEADNELELRRNELAAYFGCAPSQINYVLATRFSPEHGYVTESRRGGSGYVRIIRILPGCDRSQMVRRLLSQLEEAITYARACAMIASMAERGLLTVSEAGIMASALSDAALNMPIGVRDALSASILKNMFMSLLTIREGTI